MSDPLANLTARKRLYVKGIAQGKTKKQAALDAGYSVSVAEKAKSHIETHDLRQAFAQLIRKRVPAHKISQRIAEGLDAMETKFFQKDGVVIEARDVVAWSERRAYAELAANMGGYVSEGDKGTNVGVRVVVEHIGTQNQVATQAVATVEVMG